MQKKSLFILFIFNCILVGAGWTLALYSYPRLPQRMPLWLHFLGQSPMMMRKSILFFIYPVSQIIFNIVFILLARLLSSRRRALWERALLMDHVLLSLIFFNLIFIHALSSLVLLAHQIRGGINSFYFIALFLVVIILIPYYRLRGKILQR
ncbi:MAG: hypothetical protein JXB23_10555 [Candidatus Aminicenantes bacterium]|nr:hypothetical protein [Candidatus Aminicenantes bacterium]